MLLDVPVELDPACPELQPRDVNALTANAHADEKTSRFV